MEILFLYFSVEMLRMNILMTPGIILTLLTTKKYLQ